MAYTQKAIFHTPRHFFITKVFFTNNMKTIFTVLVALFFAQLSFAQEPAKPPIGLAIIRTPEPIEFRMDNSQFGGFGWLIHKARNSSMSGRLTGELLRNEPKLNELLRTEIETAVAKAGISIVAAPAVAINPVKPWSIDYSSLRNDGNALLHVYIEKSGIQSRSDSATYRPYAHVVYCLLLPNQRKECSFSDRSYYGEGYTTEDYLVYPADIVDQWSDEDDVFRRIKSVEPALQKAMIKIAGGISRNVIQHLSAPLSADSPLQSPKPPQ